MSLGFRHYTDPMTHSSTRKVSCSWRMFYVDLASGGDSQRAKKARWPAGTASEDPFRGTRDEAGISASAVLWFLLQ